MEFKPNIEDSASIDGDSVEPGDDAEVEKNPRSGSTPPALTIQIQSWATPVIASVPGWSDYAEWSKYPEQQSARIRLTAGQRYYVEALVKEAAGGEMIRPASSN